MASPNDARLDALIDEYLQEFVHIPPVDNIDQPFIRKNGDSEMYARCVLCSTSWMTMDAMEDHITPNWGHTRVFIKMRNTRIEKWKNLLYERETNLVGIRERSKALGHPKWTQHVSSMSYEYLISSQAIDDVKLI